MKYDFYSYLNRNILINPFSSFIHQPLETDLQKIERISKAFKIPKIFYYSRKLNEGINYEY